MLLLRGPVRVLRLLVVIASCVCLYPSVQAAEVIELFESSIRVGRGGELDVSEKIRLRSEGVRVKHGFVREFPTIYAHPCGFGVVQRVGFEVLRVSRDAQDEMYRIEPRANGVAIFVGNPDWALSPGVHEYVIAYRTYRQLGFFETHDELFFNITGQANVFPVLVARAIVQIPYGESADYIRAIAFTGFSGSRDQDAVMTKSVDQDGGKIVFETTRPLGIYEGLTISVGWPKGFVDSPTWRQRTVWFVSDNRSLAFLLIGFLLCLCVALYLVLWARRRHPKGTIIPLFDPPTDFSPGACAYLFKYGYSAKAFAADLVGLGVAGGLSIEKKEQFLGSFYRLSLREDAPVSYPFEVYGRIVQALFARLSNIDVKKGYNVDVARAMDTAKAWYSHRYRGLFEQHTGKAAGLGVCMLMIHAGAVLLDSFVFYRVWFFISLALYVLLFVLFITALRGYSAKGRRLVDHIAGFRMYLATAEAERIAVIGTPPVRTPEMYEQSLPYALALGVEKQWSAQFAPMFKAYEAEHGHAYRPVWITGAGIDAFNTAIFASAFTSAINNSVYQVSAAPGAPGSKSGFSSGSGAGGGGGGGGISGW